MQSELEVLFGWKIVRFYCSKIIAVVVVIVIIVMRVEILAIIVTIRVIVTVSITLTADLISYLYYGCRGEYGEVFGL